MVEGYWLIDSSVLYSSTDKVTIKTSLANKINSDGFLLIKSQVHRSQLENKQEVIRKFNELLERTLKKKKKRKPTKPTKASEIKRLENKNKAGIIKQDRQKISYEE